ncbi:uncharacterized protein N0V89_006352 [Didymosphaeria variabile]|uniref:Amino acid transporter n=1 Tax=Didymosphaeria variabile TaxID=1932322 RepID=A0A9W8XPY5_9PLEO|nr:uncharacterized protein N0V89_006352 [Didymosphaeria variabile]KAJ4354615.1 hypothetical protein N0V89_006352 [Didymosphaeria variabile]
MPQDNLPLDTLASAKGQAATSEAALPQYDIDNAELTRLGKKPVLKRNFGLVSMLAFACTVMITWEGVLLLFSISFTNGGFAGSVYEYIMVWLGTMATFATMGELASMAPTAGGQYHWTSMLAPKFCRKFLSYFIGWLTMIGPSMSEEISNPAVNVPRAMVFSLVLNGTLGLAMLIATLFCLGDADTVLGTATGYPFMEIFRQAVENVPGALTMSALISILNMCATISFVATASRMTWAFARDRGTPGWRFLSKIEPRTTLPLMSIMFTIIVAVLLSFIGLGSPVAFNSVVSLSINGLYTSYLIGNALLLYRRVTGAIKAYDPYDRSLANVDCDSLTWGPWKIPEPFGTIVNGFGCAYLVVILIFSFWPIGINPTPKDMNYSSLMCGAVAIFSLLYYFVRGKKTYKGPVVEIDGAEPSK